MPKMTKMIIFIHFFAFCSVLKLGYGKYKKIIKFSVDVLSFIYFLQRNMLGSNISSSFLEI